jgi:hypothetical protein
LNLSNAGMVDRRLNWILVFQLCVVDLVICVNYSRQWQVEYDEKLHNVVVYDGCYVVRRFNFFEELYLSKCILNKRLSQLRCWDPCTLSWFHQQHIYVLLIRRARNSLSQK